MKVQDFIEQLQELDPEKYITVSMPDPDARKFYKGNSMGYERYEYASIEIRDYDQSVELYVDF